MSVLHLPKQLTACLWPQWTLSRLFAPLPLLLMSPCLDLPPSLSFWFIPWCLSSEVFLPSLPTLHAAICWHQHCSAQTRFCCHPLGLPVPEGVLITVLGQRHALEGLPDLLEAEQVREGLFYFLMCASQLVGS